MTQETRQWGEKQEEKDEKQRNEKTNDRLSAVAWAVVLMWAGVVFLAQSMAPELFRVWQPWSLILVGAGVVFLLEALARTQLPEYRRPVGGTLVFAIILIAVGLGDQVGWGVVGPIALIVAGAAVLLTTIFRRR